MLPYQFYRLTPREFYLIWDGYLRRRNEEEETRAYVMATIINGCSSHLKQPVTVEALLGRPLKANMEAANSKLAEKDRRRREANKG